MDNQTIKEFTVNLYDLLANNTEYEPRKNLDYYLENFIEDYHIDCDAVSTKIVLYGKSGDEYEIAMRKVHQG